MDQIQVIQPGHLSGAIATAFMIMMNILIIQKNDFTNEVEYPKDAKNYILQNFDEKFDFIIVGAGAAGCVLANRLTENENWKVLLVEAGEDPSATSEVPAFYPVIKATKEDWQFVTEEDPRVYQGMQNRVCQISKGKALGGTSTINNLLYMRAIPYDFERWYASGNWHWNSMSLDEFYETLENYHDTTFPHYGKEGELRIENLQSNHYVKDIIQKAVEELQVPAGTYLGYVNLPANVHKGARYNMAKAFLRSIRQRPNLFVLKNCAVSKLFIPDLREKRVKGVKCNLQKETLHLRAKHEVILSAGAINSAKILLRSGIGPKNYLSEINIPLVANLQVGKNLQEHIGVPVFVGLSSKNSQNNITTIADSTYNYMMHRKGHLSVININDLVGFINTGESPFELPNIAVYHYFFNKSDIQLSDFLKHSGFGDDVTKSLLKYNEEQAIVMFTPTLLKPQSRGSVLLNATNPTGNPLIKANFLSDDEDLLTMLFAFKYITRLVKTAPFLQDHARLLQIDIPGCRNLKFGTDLFYRCHIKNLILPQGDVVGTTKMGPVGESDAVVDENLVVKGILGLRVVDSSFMPQIISANIQGTMAMVAEKISQHIANLY